MADNNMGFSDPLDSIVNRVKEKESKSTILQVNQFPHKDL
jgi:hypothetical protein